MSNPLSQIMRGAAGNILAQQGSRTTLSPQQEIEFQSWYAQRAKQAGIDPDPDNPLHKYDYRGAFAAGEEPAIDPGDKQLHWPSRFKADDHPNRMVQGVDTKALDSAGAAQGTPYAKWQGPPPQGKNPLSEIMSPNPVSQIMGSRSGFDPSERNLKQVPVPPQEEGWLSKTVDYVHEKAEHTAKGVMQFEKYFFSASRFDPSNPISGFSGAWADDLNAAADGDLAAAQRAKLGQEGAAFVGSFLVSEYLAAGRGAQVVARPLLNRAARWLGPLVAGAVAQSAIEPLEEGQTPLGQTTGNVAGFVTLGAGFHLAGKALGAAIGKTVGSKWGRYASDSFKEWSKKAGKKEAEEVGKRAGEIVRQMGDIPAEAEAQVYAKALDSAVEEVRLLSATEGEKIVNLYNDLRGGKIGMDKGVNLASLVEQIRGKPLSQVEFREFLKDLGEDGEHLAIRKWGQKVEKKAPTVTAKVVDEGVPSTTADFTVEGNEPPKPPAEPELSPAELEAAGWPAPRPEIDPKTQRLQNLLDKFGENAFAAEMGATPNIPTPPPPQASVDISWRISPKTGGPSAAAQMVDQYIANIEETLQSGQVKKFGGLSDVTEPLTPESRTYYEKLLVQWKEAGRTGKLPPELIEGTPPPETGGKGVATRMVDQYIANIEKILQSGQARKFGGLSDLAEPLTTESRVYYKRLLARWRAAKSTGKLPPELLEGTLPPGELPPEGGAPAMPPEGPPPTPVPQSVRALDDQIVQIEAMLGSPQGGPGHLGGTATPDQIPGLQQELVRLQAERTAVAGGPREAGEPVAGPVLRQVQGRIKELEGYLQGGLETAPESSGKVPLGGHTPEVKAKLRAQHIEELKALKRAEGVLSGKPMPQADPLTDPLPYSVVRRDVSEILDKHEAPREIVPKMQLIRMLHGTRYSFNEFDLAKADAYALYARGLYFTENARVAGGTGEHTFGYAGAVKENFTVKGLKQEIAAYEAAGNFSMADKTRATLEAVEATLSPEIQGPNIRVHYLDIRNPLDVDKPVPEGIIRLLGLDPDKIVSTNGKILGDDVFTALVKAVGEDRAVIDARVDAHIAGKDVTTFLPDMVIAKLKSVGYDGITHEGGKISGGERHQVWIAWEPKQVKNYFEMELKRTMMEAAQSPGEIAEIAVRDATADAVVADMSPLEIMDPAMKSQSAMDIAENPYLPRGSKAQDVVRGVNGKVDEISEAGVPFLRDHINEAVGRMRAEGKEAPLSEVLTKMAKEDPANAPNLKSLAKVAKGFEEENLPPLSSLGDLESDPAAGAEARGEWHTQTEEQLRGWAEMIQRFFNSDDGRISRVGAIRIGALSLSGYSFYRSEETDDPRAKALWGVAGGMFALIGGTPGNVGMRILQDSGFPYKFLKTFDLGRMATAGTKKAMDQWKSTVGVGATFGKFVENRLRPVFPDEHAFRGAMYSIDEGPMAPEWSRLTPNQQREVASQAMLNQTVFSELHRAGLVTPENARADFIRSAFKDRETGDLWYRQWESLSKDPVLQKAFGTMREAEKWATGYNRKGPEIDITKVQGKYAAEASRRIANSVMQDQFKHLHLLMPFDDLAVLSQNRNVISARNALREVKVPLLGGKMMATDEVATALERANGTIYGGRIGEYVQAFDYMRGLMMRGIMVWPWEHGVNIMRGAYALNWNASLYFEYLKKVKAADPQLLEISKYVDLFHRPDFGPQGVKLVDDALAKLGAQFPTLKKLGLGLESLHARGERALWDRWVPAFGSAAWSKYMLNWTKQTGGRYLIGSPEYEVAAQKAGEFAHTAIGKIPELIQDPHMSLLLRQMWFSPQWTRTRLALTAHAMGEVRQIAAGELKPGDAMYLGVKLRAMIVGLVGTAVMSYALSQKWPKFNPNTNKFYVRTGVRDDRGHEQGVDITGWYQDDLKLFNDPWAFYRDRQNPMLREANKQVSGRDVFGNPMVGMERLESVIQSIGPIGEAASLAGGVVRGAVRGKAPTFVEMMRATSGIAAVGNISALPTTQEMIINKMAAKQLRMNKLPVNRDDVSELARLMRQNYEQSGDYNGDNVQSWLGYRRRAYGKKHPISWLWQEGKKVVRDLSK